MKAWRRGALLLPFLLLTAALVVSGAAPPPKPSQPNILLLTIDTIRWDAPGFAGNPRPASPFLDSLAATAIVYRNAQSTSSWTVPAIASMMTGLYPKTHAVVHGAVGDGNVYDQEVIPAEFPLLAERLKKLGYRTYAVTSNAHLNPDMGYGRGFDRYLSVGFTTADSVTRTVLRWKDLIPTGKGPWFLWVHYYDPHHPYREQRPWFRDFAGDVTPQDGPLLIGAKASPPAAPRRGTKEAERFAYLARALYDAEVRYTDESIRSLFGAMPYLADAEIVFAGDHGEEFLEHGGTGHCRNLNGETVRIPLFVRHADGHGHGTSDALVSILDIPTTIVALAGGTPPADRPGIPLADPGVAEAIHDRELVAQLERNRDHGLYEGLIGPRWKILTNRLTGRNELYDLAADPRETTNLAASNTLELNGELSALERAIAALPPPPKVVERKVLSKEVEAQLRGQGYIH